MPVQPAESEHPLDEKKKKKGKGKDKKKGKKKKHSADVEESAVEGVGTLSIMSWQHFAVTD